MSGRPLTAVGAASPIPRRCGIGLRAPHHEAVVTERPAVGWLEVHSENYFADGGAQLDHLARARELYPVSLHGVGLSLGSVDPLNREHLRRLKRLADWAQPVFISEHLSWGSFEGRFLNDLLPLPHTHEALAHMIARVGELQDHLGREVLIENISSYLRFNDEEMPEPEFLSELAAASGCGLLIDVNNVHVSAMNHGFDAYQYLDQLPPSRVREMHLAGHSVNEHHGRPILIDTHSAPVSADVWALYAHALQRLGPTPTLIEWDTDIPALEVLVAEARKADQSMEQVLVRAA